MFVCIFIAYLGLNEFSLKLTKSSSSDSFERWLSNLGVPSNYFFTFKASKILKEGVSRFTKSAIVSSL